MAIVNYRLNSHLFLKTKLWFLIFTTFILKLVELKNRLQVLYNPYTIYQKKNFISFPVCKKLRKVLIFGRIE